MADYLDFTLKNITATADRKLKIKNSFAKQVNWTEKIPDPEDPEKEIDNPVTFKQCFNRAVTEFIRQTAVAGQQKIDKELAEPYDEYEELK